MWPFVSALIALMSAIEGYRSVIDGSLKVESAPWILYLSLVLVCGILPVLSVYSSIRKENLTVLERPSPHRNLFRWQRDPLQFVFVLGLASAAAALGGVIALVGSWPTGRWMFGANCAILFGILLGYSAVLRIFRRYLDASGRAESVSDGVIGRK